ncbi:hypothetical protein LSCM1_00528 [Leishmania martiniquensis]|uniref:START domain-containing protein n=1 Tax=Leishmania martiniquensis TaxID=1580590 RepID=A0A836K8U4_9TRYP|nr:hypothetical protein LSCM1_00528 [Leishmania martiniquensis]
MLASSDEDVVAAVPVLKSLLALVAVSPASWKQLSSCDGYTVCEIPPMPALGLPLKSYRTQFVVNADLDSFQRVLNDETSLREYDPTLKDLRTLERRACTTLLYTSYVSPSPWLIAPRDFCVWCASVLTTPQQLKRVCRESADGTGEPSIGSVTPSECGQTWQGFQGPLDPSQTLYLQNSVNALELDCAAVPTSLNGKPLVRGVVYCFGYVAFADPSIEGRLRVTNYCCVDPAGQLTQWLVATAVNENTKKLRKIAALAEAAAAAAPAAARIVSCPSVLSAPPSPAEEALKRSCSVTSHRKALSDTTREDGVTTPPPTEVHCDAAQSPPLPTVMGVPASEKPPSPKAEADAASLEPPASTGSSPRPHLAQVERRSASPLSMRKESTPAYLHTLTSKPLQRPDSVAISDSRIELLSLLARANGWRTRRESGEVQYAELRSLPEPLCSKDPLCVAMRVSTSVRCRLDTFAAVSRNPALFPEIDPELVRVVSTSTPSVASSLAPSREPSTSGHGAVPAARAATEASLFFSTNGRLDTVSQVRHYQFDAGNAFRYPWDMILHCSDVELTHLDGGRYGFHTPGVHAATYVWVGAENTTSYYRGAHPDGYHRHMRVRLFGLTAVAVPRCADTVRVSQYMLFEAGAPLPPMRQNRWHLTFQKKSPKEEFLPSVAIWMEGRMKRLCRIGEEQQCRLNSSAMVALDKMPLLYFLYQVHRAEGSRALESPETALYGDVLARPILWAGKGGNQRLGTEGGSSEPPLLVLATVFPCSLTKLRNYMQLSPARHRYALESGLHAYEEFPSPPDFTAVRVAYGAASATFPWVRLTLLEAFGEICGANVSSPTLVLSRVGVDGDVGSDCEQLNFINVCVGALHRSADEHFEDGRVFCSGWVATKLEGDANHADANSTLGALERLCSGHTPVSLELFRKRPNAGSKSEDAAVQSPQRIMVTQYLSVGLSPSRQHHLDANGLPHGCIAEQASLLQRFRDAVCSWDFIEAAPSP